jgi:hypothetical protein
VQGGTKSGVNINGVIDIYRENIVMYFLKNSIGINIPTVNTTTNFPKKSSTGITL